MELEDVSYSDEDGYTAADAYDEVKPFTPPSSPEPDRRRQTKSEPKRTCHKNTKSSRSNGKFVELESESDEFESPNPVGRARPIQVKPRKILELDIDNDVEQPTSHVSKEKSKSKKSRQKKSQKSKSESPERVEDGWKGDLKGIFEIDGMTSDVILNRDGLIWASVEMGLTTPKKKSKKRTNCEQHLKYEQILAVKIKRQRKGKQVEGEGICLGIAIQTFEEKDSGRLKNKIFLFGNPSQDVCLEWSRRIQAVTDEFKNRPRKLIVFLQPYAGKKNSRAVYKKEVLPLFEMAGIETNYIEVNHNEHIKHEIIHMDIKDFDCVVCVGGDGTVSKVVGYLLNKTQKDNNIEMMPTAGAVPAPLPVGIIPTGTVNQICHTVQGNEDIITAVIHIVLGHTCPTDICSVYQDEQFYGWAFSGHYGFFSSVLRLSSRYSAFGDRRIHAALVKALTKSKYRSYECEIKYLPYTEDTTHNPYNSQPCRQGCKICASSNSINTQEAPTLDKVHSLDKLNESNNSSTLDDLTEDDPWKVIKGNFVSVSVLSTPALSELSPLGMSRYGHLTDGCLDLILVEKVNTREFTRYLKRHIKSKDQLNLSFVKAFRCKEIQFHSRGINSWDHKDYSVNEILDGIKKTKTNSKHGLHRADSVQEIDDLSSDFDDSDVDTEAESVDNSQSKDKVTSAKKTKDKQKQTKTTDVRKSVGMFCVEDKENGATSLGYVNENFQEDTGNDKVFTSKDSLSKEPTSHKVSSKISPNSKQKAQEKLARNADMLMHVTSEYRPTLVEQENAHRLKSQRKHEQKKRERDIAKNTSFWNLDTEKGTEVNLHFKTHQGLVRLCGQGIPANFKPDEQKSGCLHIF